MTVQGKSKLNVPLPKLGFPLDCHDFLSLIFLPPSPTPLTYKEQTDISKNYSSFHQEVKSDIWNPWYPNNSGAYITPMNMFIHNICGMHPN